MVPSALYAELFRASIAGHRTDLERTLVDIGFVDQGERCDRIDGLVDFFLIACEPFRHRGAYDFGNSDLPPRVRAAAVEVTVRRGLLRSPPPDTIFLHRKLAGTFLHCARLGAHLDVRALLEPFLSGVEPATRAQHG